VNALENAHTTANLFSGNISVTGTDDGSRPSIPEDVTDIFNWRIQNNETIGAMPVVAEGLQGSHGVTIVGFVEVKPIKASGHPGKLVTK
jgi:hypothetical protein